MAANTNGLLAPTATYGALSSSYYALASGGTIVQPTLVQPTVIQPLRIKAADASGSTATIYVDPLTSGAYQGAVNITPGGNAFVPAGSAGITIRAAPGGGLATASTIVEIGTNGEGPNELYIAGAQGVGQVYDEVYNPPVNPIAVASSTGSLPITTIPRGFAFSYTPDKTGAYMLQVNVNIRNADAIPLDGFIEWVLSDGAEVQYASSTLNSNQLIKVAGMDEINGVPGGLPEPTDFTFSNLCFLTAGVAVSLSITTARNSTVGGLSWSIQNYDARLIQMC